MRINTHKQHNQRKTIYCEDYMPLSYTYYYVLTITESAISNISKVADTQEISHCVCAGSIVITVVQPCLTLINVCSEDKTQHSSPYL